MRFEEQTIALVASLHANMLMFFGFQLALTFWTLHGSLLADQAKK
jgi:hypothetical protein